VSTITAGQDVYNIGDIGRSKGIAIGRESESEYDEDGYELRAYDREVLKILSKLEEGYRYVGTSVEKMDTRIFTLESEIKKVATSRWSWFDVLFVAGLSTLISLLINFLSRFL
jgi:hypothetical protein